jgi:hypothetical protein
MELELMETEIPNDDQQETSFSDTDWDNRILCSDGSCIGVIGPDGHCKECGKKYEGTLPETVASDKESQSPMEDESRANAAYDSQPQPSADITSEEETQSDDWANRQLCSDGNCIGVIGPDGRCTECGKPFKG